MADREELLTIDIVALSDFLGELEGDTGTGAALLAAYMNDFKQRNPAGTLILDAGDAFQGSLLSTAFRGRPVIELMNAIGYDAMTVGNHEWDWGVEELLEVMEPARFPLLGANICLSSGERAPWAAPYHLIERSGLRIGIVGFTTIETLQVTLKSKLKGYTICEARDIADEIFREVKNKGADIIVVLGHLPIYCSPITHDYYGELVELVREFHPYIDAAIGGHHLSPCQLNIEGEEGHGPLSEWT